MDGKLGRIDEKHLRVIHNSPCYLRNRITITTDDLMCAVSGNEETVQSISLAVDFVNRFREITVKCLMVLAHEIAEAEQGEANDPDQRIAASIFEIVIYVW